MQIICFSNWTIKSNFFINQSTLVVLHVSDSLDLSHLFWESEYSLCCMFILC